MSALIAPESLTVVAFPVPAGSRPHDVAPALDGGVWYTAQGSGELGWLNPVTGETRHIALGAGSRPHGVIIDEQGTPWVTDSGLNAIVSVDPGSDAVTIFPLPDDTPEANLNTASFDADGTLWFTGNAGIYGSLDVDTGEMRIFEAPGGRGPYGITTTPKGSVFYASLAGSYIGAVDQDGSVTVIEPPTPGQGARRVWSDSAGAIWVSEWNSGQLSRYLPETGEWSSWLLPGADPAAYGVYVDESDIVWVSDFGSNSLLRFDPITEEFDVYPLPHDPGDVRQILGRPGEIWGAESAADQLVLIRTR
ncbi:MAG: lyase [Acidobacteria bacterium]|nr:lyase [Acidobacteriota bacterium]